MDAQAVPDTPARVTTGRSRGRHHEGSRAQIWYRSCAFEHFARPRIDLGAGESHRLSERLRQLQQQLVHRDRAGQPAPECPKDLVWRLARPVDESRRRIEEARPNRHEDEGSDTGGHHGQCQNILVSRGLWRVAQAEHHHQVDRGDHDDEPEHREDLYQAAAGMWAHRFALGGQQTDRHEHGRSCGDSTELPGPPDQQVEDRHAQRQRGGRGHADAEPLHPLAVVADRSDVAASHRGDGQRSRDGPAHGAVGQAERPVVEDERQSDGHCDRIPADGQRAPDTVAEATVGQGEEEVEGDGGDDQGGQCGHVPRTARCVRHLRLPARSQGHRSKQRVRCCQQMEGGGLGPDPLLGAGVHNADEGPGQCEPEGDRNCRSDASGCRHTPPDDDARHGEGEEDDLQQREPPERTGSGRRHDHWWVPYLHMVTDGHRSPRTARPRGAPTPRPRQSFRRACGRFGRPPRRHRHRESRERWSAHPRAAG